VSPLISFDMATPQPRLRPFSLAKTVFPCTVHPVCVSTFSHTLLEHDALSAFIMKLSRTRQCSPRTRARLRGTCKADARFVSLRAIQMQTGPRCFRWPPIKTCWMRRGLCAHGPQAILLNGGHVTRSVMRVSDVEAVVDATTALGHPRVGTIVWQRGANLGGCGGVVGTHDVAQRGRGHSGCRRLLCKVAEVVDPGEE
jgi:hypothetical protein